MDPGVRRDDGKAAAEQLAGDQFQADGENK
jgi:hypothetical protein